MKRVKIKLAVSRLKKILYDYQFLIRKNLYFLIYGRGKDWHRESIGGHWEERGRLQEDFFIKHGLKPEHYFLDIGCGPLRGGVRFIKYLEPGHYYGIEKEPSLLKAAQEIELERHCLVDRKPNLLLIDNFDLSALRDVQFDFMFAYSVFTHLLPEMVERCLVNVIPKLKKNGVFYATFYESKDREVQIGRPHCWRKDEFTSVAYPFYFFQDICQDIGIFVEYLNDWDHPGGQKMLAFKR